MKMRTGPRKDRSKLLTIRVERARRVFEFVMDAEITDWLVYDVINKLEIDELHVFQPDDQRAFSGESLLKRATLPIKIRDWFPMACQLIQEARIDDYNTHALFSDNASHCLFRIDGRRPIGPANLQCEIRLSRRLFSGRNPAAPDAIRLVVAHELAHAFDLLRFTGPAILDWNEYWRKPLAEGRNCRQVLQRIEDLALRLDDYGSQSELESLRRFWPSHAEEWIEAARKLRDGE
jgi:hypothetical protein